MDFQRIAIVAAGIGLLSAAAASFEILRYEYVPHTNFSYVLRIDRLTGEMCYTLLNQYSDFGVRSISTIKPCR